MTQKKVVTNMCGDEEVTNGSASRPGPTDTSTHNTTRTSFLNLKTDTTASEQNKLWKRTTYIVRQTQKHTYTHTHTLDRHTHAGKQWKAEE